MLKAFGMLKLEGRHVFHPRVDYHRFTHLSIQTEEPTAINIDGENIGSTPSFDAGRQARRFHHATGLERKIREFFFLFVVSDGRLLGGFNAWLRFLDGPSPSNRRFGLFFSTNVAH